MARHDRSRPYLDRLESLHLGLTDDRRDASRTLDELVRQDEQTLQRLRDTGDYEAAKKAFIARQPIGRIAKAEEIASMCAYLASDKAAYITGATININGGLHMC